MLRAMLDRSAQASLWIKLEHGSIIRKRGRDRMVFINNHPTGVTCAETHAALEREPDGERERERERERESRAELVPHFSDVTINHGDSSKPSLRACHLMKLLRRCDHPIHVGEP